MNPHKPKYEKTNTRAILVESEADQQETTLEGKYCFFITIDIVEKLVKACNITFGIQNTCT